MKPTSYRFNNDTDTKKHFGFIAQDVEKVYPDMVKDDVNGMKSLHYDDIIPVAVANIQDLKKMHPNENQLCLGDVCIDKEELKALKKKI